MAETLALPEVELRINVSIAVEMASHGTGPEQTLRLRQYLRDLPEDLLQDIIGQPRFLLEGQNNRVIWTLGQPTNLFTGPEDLKTYLSQIWEQHKELLLTLNQTPALIRRARLEFGAFIHQDDSVPGWLVEYMFPSTGSSSLQYVPLPARAVSEEIVKPEKPKSRLH